MYTVKAMRSKWREVGQYSDITRALLQNDKAKVTRDAAMRPAVSLKQRQENPTGTDQSLALKSMSLIQSKGALGCLYKKKEEKSV